MNRVLLLMATGALLAIASMMSASNASAHDERCVCTSSMAVPPVPPVAPVPPVPPMPPGHHVRREVIIINPDGAHHMRHVRRIVRVVENTGGGRMTREDFVHRAEKAFDEHDKNHDGVLEDNE